MLIAEPESLRRLKTAMAAVEFKVAIAGTARGVGVSTVAANLALALRQGAKEGDDEAVEAVKGNLRVGILHLGPGFKPAPDRPGITVLYRDKEWGDGTEWHVVHESLTGVDWTSLDLLLVELPVGIERVGDLSEVFPALDAAVIVTLSSDHPRDRVRKLWKFFDDSAIPVIGLVTNMEGRLKGEDVEELGQTFGIPIRVSIPYEPTLSTDQGQEVPYVLAQRETSVSRTFFDFSEDLADYLVWLHDEHEQEEEF